MFGHPFGAARSENSVHHGALCGAWGEIEFRSLECVLLRGILFEQLIELGCVNEIVVDMVSGRFVVGCDGLEAAEFGDGAELEALVLGAGAVDGSLEFFEGGEVGFVLFEEV